MGEDEVGQDFPGRMDLEVARGQGGEVGFQFLLAQVLGREAADFLHQQFALLLLGAGELGAAGHELQGFVVQRAEEQVLEAVPELVAGGLGIDKGVEGEQGKGFRASAPAWRTGG